MYIKQKDIKPITAKKYLLCNWQKYDVVDTKDDFVALLNVLQACDENLDSLHDAATQGYEFCDILGNWQTDREVVNSLNQFCHFFTEEEFIDYIMERWQEEKESYGYSDSAGTEYIRKITSDDNRDYCDTQITKTDDGYVVRVWY